MSLKYPSRAIGVKLAIARMLRVAKTTSAPHGARSYKPTSRLIRWPRSARWLSGVCAIIPFKWTSFVLLEIAKPARATVPVNRAGEPDAANRLSRCSNNLISMAEFKCRPFARYNELN